MCLKLHPDRTHIDECEKFQEIQKAYEVLINPAKREKYDADGTIDEKQTIYIVTDKLLDKCREKYAGSYSMPTNKTTKMATIHDLKI